MTEMKKDSNPPTEIAATKKANPLVDAHGNLISPPNMAMLESALANLTPDCDKRTVAIYRIAPLVEAAKLFPDLSVELKRLAQRWYNGELRGTDVTGWKTAGSNGLTGEEYLEHLWTHFNTNTAFKGKKTTLGSIFFHAKQAGWVWLPAEFETAEFETEGA